jgi:hypothetical protein
MVVARLFVEAEAILHERCVVRWVGGIDEERLYFSATTSGEIKKGIERL